MEQRQRLPPDFLARPAVRKALAAGDVPAMIELAREALGVSQGELGALLGYSQSWVSRVVTGRRPLTMEQARHVAVRLGLPAELLMLVRGDDTTRREFAKLIAAAGLAPMADQADAARLGVDRVLRSPAGPADVAEWHRIVGAYTRMGRLCSPRQVLDDMLIDFRELGGQLERADASMRQRLAQVAGQLAALIATRMASEGQETAADRWWRTARRAADRSGDRDLSSFVRGRHAAVSLYGTASTPADSLALADDAVATGRGRPRPGVMIGLAARAQALAGLGARRGATEAYAALERLFDRAPDGVTSTDEPTGWPERRLRYVDSYVHTRLGETRRAMAAQARALQLYPDGQYRGPAQVELQRAACLIAEGDVTGGADHAHDVLARLSADQRHDQLVVSVARSTLAAVPEQARGLRQVAGYRDLLADLPR